MAYLFHGEQGFHAAGVGVGNGGINGGTIMGG
jgi:hypothetical protein